MIQNYIKFLGGSKEDIEKLFDMFIADIIQNPGKKGELALILRGLEGCGKSTLFQLIQALDPAKSLETANISSDLFGDFNGHLMNNIIIGADETKAGDTFSLADRLKNFISQPKTVYQLKGKERFTGPSFSRVIFTTNNDCCIKVGKGARRFAAIDIDKTYIGNTEYWETLYDAINNPAAVYLFYQHYKTYEMNGKLKDNIPETDLLHDMKARVVPAEILFMIYYGFESIDDEDLATRTNLHTVTAPYLYAKFKLYVADQQIKFEPTSQVFGLNLKNQKIDGVVKQSGNGKTWYVMDWAKIKNWMITNRYMEPDTVIVKEVVSSAEVVDAIMN